MLQSTRLPRSARAFSTGPRPGPSGRSRLQVTAAIKEKSGKEILCSKTLVALKGKEQTVADLCAKVEQHGLAAAKDRATGVLQYGVLQDQFEGNVFHFYERYVDNVSLGRFNTRPEVQKFMEEVQPLLEGPVGMALYECRNGKLGSVCVQGGPKGEGGLDDVSGASGAAGGASMKQTSATVDAGSLSHDAGDDEPSEEVGTQLKKQVDTFTKSFNQFANMFSAGAKK